MFSNPKLLLTYLELVFITSWWKLSLVHLSYLINLYVSIYSDETTNSKYWKEYSWKVLICYFKTPLIQSKYKENKTSRCWRECNEQTANHTHILVFLKWKWLLGNIYWRTVQYLWYFFRQKPTISVTWENTRRDR